MHGGGIFVANDGFFFLTDLFGLGGLRRFHLFIRVCRRFIHQHGKTLGMRIAGSRVGIGAKRSRLLRFCTARAERSRLTRGSAVTVKDRRLLGRACGTEGSCLLGIVCDAVSSRLLGVTHRAERSRLLGRVAYRAERSRLLGCVAYRAERSRLLGCVTHCTERSRLLGCVTHRAERSRLLGSLTAHAVCSRHSGVSRHRVRASGSASVRLNLAGKVHFRFKYADLHRGRKRLLRFFHGGRILRQRILRCDGIDVSLCLVNIARHVAFRICSAFAHVIFRGDSVFGLEGDHVRRRIKRDHVAGIRLGSSFFVQHSHRILFRLDTSGVVMHSVAGGAGIIFIGIIMLYHEKSFS